MKGSAANISTIWFANEKRTENAHKILSFNSTYAACKKYETISKARLLRLTVPLERSLWMSNLFNTCTASFLYSYACKFWFFAKFQALVKITFAAK